MRHIKTFEGKKEITARQKRGYIESAFFKSRFTPSTDKFSLSSIYQYLIIEVESGECITIDKWSTVEIWEDDDSGVTSAIRKALDNISDETYDDIYFDDFDDFKSYDVVKNILDYNPVNFQEIENVLIDYGYSVDNIWGAID